MSGRRMDAYYYGFDPTNVDCVDKILSAVACAGKAHHYTGEWTEDAFATYDDHTGTTPVEWIQNAGDEAAAEITHLRAENERVREALVEAAIPLEALLLCMGDPAMRLAPEMQTGIRHAVETIRTALKRNSE